MLISVSACFYTLFLFDVLGDSVGLHNSYWVLIVVPLLPLWMYSMYNLYVAVRPAKNESQPKSGEQSEDIESEMRSVEISSAIEITRQTEEVCGDASLNADNIQAKEIKSSFETYNIMLESKVD